MPSPRKVIILGAGWTGLAAAKTYLSLFPSIHLTVLDAQPTLGGVWSKSRAYPGLLADSPAANFEFSDLEMEGERWGDLEAENVSEYLERWVEKNELGRYLRLGWRVVQVERGGDGGWRIEVESIKDGQKEVLSCEKLVVAAGVHSIPKFPSDVSWKQFQGPVMHSRDIGMKHGLLIGEGVRRVTVVGGNKSAVDAVYLCAKAGKEVDWVISPHGFGPGILFEPRTKDGTSFASIKLARASLLPSPSFLNKSGFWYWFLHSGKCSLGTWVLSMAMRWVTRDMMRLYTRNENTMKIAPDLPDLFWTPAALSIIHDPTFFDLVAEGKLIHVHRSTITSTTSHSIHLANNEILTPDAIVFATGWTTSHSSLFPSPLLPELGLPIPLSEQSPDLEKHWNTLDTASMDYLKDLFPTLANPPKEVREYDALHEKKPSTTPFRLFRGMVPPILAARCDRSLIMPGMVINISVPIMAEVSSLWGVAYLENLPFIEETGEILQSRGEMEKEVSVANNMGWLRYRDKSAAVVDAGEVTQWCIDQLVRDLGLRTDRKRFGAEREGRKGWFGLRALYEEWFEAYVAADYRGLIEEYKLRWGLE